MHSPVVRSIVRERSDTIEDGHFTVHTWNDLLGVFPGLIGVKTGHTDKAGWNEVAAARRQGYTIYVAILGSPSRGQRNADLEHLLSWGVSQYRTLTLVKPTRRTPRRPWATAGRRWRSWPRSRSSTSFRPTAPWSSGSSRPRPSGSRWRRASSSVPSRSAWADSSSAYGRSSPPGRSSGPGSAAGSAGTPPAPSTISWGSSDDRHRHTQRRRRPDADRAELPARAPAPRVAEHDHGRRQGHQRRPRAEAARHAGDRDGARRRPDRRPHHRGARGRGDPQRLRAHLRRVAHVERVRRPDRRDADGDLRVGPGGPARRARHAARQAALPLARRDLRRLQRARCRATSRTTSTPRRSAT